LLGIAKPGDSVAVGWLVGNSITVQRRSLRNSVTVHWRSLRNSVTHDRRS
jgi:hypothetical protein